MKRIPLALTAVLFSVGLIWVTDAAPRSAVKPEKQAGDDVLCHTFSIVAYDPVAKEWGVGVASKVLAVGAVVPFARAEVGAIATQSYANKAYGPKGLKLLSEKKTPDEVIKALTDEDEMKELRQVGVIDAQGNVANFTGNKCNPWAGAKTGKNYSCQGNLLAGEAVVTDMAKAFEETEGKLAWRLIASMEAAEKAGGDKRGKQSAAILVVRDKAGYFGFDDRYIDLRVDDHDEPVKELGRVLSKKIPKKK